MAPRKGANMLSAMMDPLSEDEFARSEFDMIAQESLAETRPTKRKAPSKPNKSTVAGVSKAVKAKVSRKATATAPATAMGRRLALADLTNVNDAEEDEEEDEEEQEPPPKKRDRKTVPAKQSARKVARPRKAVAARDESLVIAETQRETIEDTEPTGIEESVVEEMKAIRPVPLAYSRARSSSRQLEPILSSRHRRGGSASDTERGTSEPALRRKLGDVTSKFENLDLKYRNLKELASTGGQSNLDKLRLATDQRAKDQDNLIASLRKELAAQQTLAAGAKSSQARVAQLESENSRLVSENTALTTSVATSQKEIKTLTAKIAASRTQPDKLPSSAVKNGPRGNTVASSHAAEAQNLKLKEDLYSDLTGLMIHNVKRLEGEDVFDCIQTGRNGTLRFHLSVSHEPPPTATPGATTFDDAEFAYSPLLDDKNDRDLLELLPDYLTEEICFPRSSAARFYSKVADCMTKKIEFED